MNEQNNEQALEMMVNNQEEKAFFLSHLKPHMRVLEWGSGGSTLVIAPMVKRLISIEHHEGWFQKMKPLVPVNVRLFFVPPDQEPGPEYDDGTLNDFAEYVNSPLNYLRLHEYPPFDVIFIDGRARVACASVCKLLGHKDTLVFIHDYNHPEEKWRRPEYYEAEKYLERIDGVFTMWKFKIKF